MEDAFYLTLEIYLLRRYFKLFNMEALRHSYTSHTMYKIKFLLRMKTMFWQIKRG